MSNKNINIIIQGTAGSGKSTIAVLIKRALKNYYGLNVAHEDTLDYRPTQKDLNEIINAFKIDRREIKISEEQLPREQNK